MGGLEKREFCYSESSPKWRVFQATIFQTRQLLCLKRGLIAELAVGRPAPRFNLTMVHFAPKTFNGLTNGFPLLSKSKGAE